MRSDATPLTRLLSVLLLGGAVIAQPLLSITTYAAEPLGNAPPPSPALEEPEALTRGPVHEAYAEPVTVMNRTDLLIPFEPPAPIDEVPPGERPTGDAIWVPGYWAWNPEAEDFIWVSGCWRSAPPGASWVPGYWAEVEGGWQWVPGFWRRAGAHEVDYLPEPPEPFELEPTVAAPSVDYVWVPGCWYWRDGRYIRRHGYWLEATPDWVWVPSHYVWTPRGYVFVRGHWDYPFERRGVLFAPAYIPRGVYVRPSYVYSPTVVLNVSAFQFSLFTAPRYSHYYFGDYYDVAYVERGIYPWYDRHHIRYWCDPIYTHDRWRHGRHEHDWEGRVRRDFDERRQRRDLRPAHTFREMRARAERDPRGERERLEIARSLAAATQDRAAPVRFERMDDTTRRRAAEQGAEIRRTREERRGREAEGRRTRTSEAVVQPVAPQPTSGAPEPRERGRENPAARPERRETPPAPAPAPAAPEPPRDTPNRSGESRSESREAPRDPDIKRETRTPRRERERNPEPPPAPPPPPAPAPAPEPPAPAPAPAPAPGKDDGPRREAPRRDDSPRADAPSRGDGDRPHAGKGDRERRSGDREAKRGR